MTADLRALLNHAHLPWTFDGARLRENGRTIADMRYAHNRSNAELAVAAVNALPAHLDLENAARNLSDRRTLDSDGFWVSQKEMRALDEALARLDKP